MILYTMMPHEQMFPAETEVYTNTVCLKYNGIELMATRDENNGYKVERIISTDPAHFLNSSVQPGSFIDYY
ncbi:YlzJ-like family protein [Peribacillus sp. SCS-155]|uniref:YlzJ-like family protein n=1 Tax=Peribacillus sedimenti TaxID=3115297 RepID=UPI003906BD40